MPRLAGAAQALQAVRADRQRWLSDAQQHARSLAALAEAVLRFELSREGRVWRTGGGGGTAGVAAAPAVDCAALTLQLGQASVALTEATGQASRCLGATIQHTYGCLSPFPLKSSLREKCCLDMMFAVTLSTFSLRMRTLNA
jgi:hypothetical protein